MANPCPAKKQSPPVVRPPWYDSGTPVVSDPLYGDIPLVLSPKPLKCYKSAAMPDGSYWMWLGGPWYRAVESPLSGMLFFALTWEYWSLLQYVSKDANNGSSVWIGSDGNGRMKGVQVTITAQR